MNSFPVAGTLVLMIFFLFVHLLLAVMYLSTKMLCDDFFNPNVYGTHQNCGIMAQIFC
uniref:Uncharacterized protein n=1 Tax=Macrostomum lignano TaxID=282301 RepID=A0A1I8GWQ4_9PLAT